MINFKKYVLILLITFIPTSKLIAMSDDYNYYRKGTNENSMEVEESITDTNSYDTNKYDRATNSLPETNNIELAIVSVESSVKVDWLGDKTASNRAIIEAKKTAVSTAAEHILSSGVMLNNFDIKKSSLLRNYDKYIKNYTVITNEKTDSMFKIQIETLVDYASIKNYLLSEGILNDENIKSSIIVAVLDDRASIDNTFNSELITIFENNNFYTIKNTENLNSLMETNNINYENILNKKELNILSAIIANEYRSKYAVVGSVVASFVAQIEGTSLYTYKSSIYLDIIDIVKMTSITNIVYQTSATSGSMDGAYNFVLKKTAKYAGDEILNIINKEIEQNKEPREYILIVDGIGYEDSLLLQKEIKNNIDGVRNVYNYGEIDNKQALTVSFVGDIKTLAIELNVKAKNIGFRILIDNYDESTIYLSAKKR